VSFNRCVLFTGGAFLMALPIITRSEESVGGGWLGVLIIALLSLGSVFVFLSLFASKRVVEKVNMSMDELAILFGVFAAIPYFSLRLFERLLIRRR